jgi:hypothetical protein
MTDHHMDELSRQIRERVEYYEQRMAAAMGEGDEGQLRHVYDEFQETVGKDVADFAAMAGGPLKSTLLALISLPTEDEQQP